MVFSSSIFLFFFLPFFLLLYFLFKNIKTKNIILLLFSLLFYAWGEPYYIFLMVIMIILNYYLTLSMDKSKKNRKKYLIVIVVLNLLSLFSFKYLNFFIDNINFILRTNIPLVRLSLPIGISFYTFQMLSYVIDVYRKKVKVQSNLIDLACYVSSFPQLIAGPIVRYADVEKELKKRRTHSDDMLYGVRRFIVGLSKKVIIANNVCFIADRLFDNGINNTGFIGVLIASIAYSLQIYYDFSGYSDMAIGLGRMLGFHYLENFKYPYSAKSITDFWRRWHISLSSFFKDYVYIPLGGNRHHHIRNIVIVWMLTGLWHGDSWNFIVWGLYYALLLLIEKYIIKDFKDTKIYHYITLILVIFGWLIFRQTDFNELLLSIKTLFFNYGFGNISKFYYLGLFSSRYILAFIFGIIFASEKVNIKDGFIKDILLLVLFIISISFIVVGSYNPFIYFRF